MLLGADLRRRIKKWIHRVATDVRTNLRVVLHGPRYYYYSECPKRERGDGGTRTVFVFSVWLHTRAYGRRWRVLLYRDEPSYTEYKNRCRRRNLGIVGRREKWKSRARTIQIVFWTTVVRSHDGPSTVAVRVRVVRHIPWVYRRYYCYYSIVAVVVVFTTARRRRRSPDADETATSWIVVRWFRVRTPRSADVVLAGPVPEKRFPDRLKYEPDVRRVWTDAKQTRTKSHAKLLTPRSSFNSAVFSGKSSGSFFRYNFRSSDARIMYNIASFGSFAKDRPKKSDMFRAVESIHTVLRTLCTFLVRTRKSNTRCRPSSSSWRMVFFFTDDESSLFVTISCPLLSAAHPCARTYIKILKKPPTLSRYVAPRR